MTQATRAAITEIAVIALLTVIAVAILSAWLHDISKTGKPSHTPVMDAQDYAAEIRRGVAMHQPQRIDDPTEIDTDYLLNDPWYKDTLVELLDSLGDRKGDVR